MNVVQGNGLHSYRLTEAMRANSVPVILADNYVLPFSEAVRWSEIAIMVRSPVHCVLCVLASP
jgi:hypothetical protein